MFARLLPDEFVSWLDEEVLAVGDDEHALTDRQKMQRKHELTREILKLNFEEEALIVLAEQTNSLIPRRHDADPRAVLMLSHTLPAPGGSR